ncbi:MAG TPA: DUF433 domain-containing protein [Anaeromyxobacteraceae bacterium]
MPSLIARHLRLPISSVRWWTLGNGSHLPVIRIASPHDQLLSFRNVAEIHVLSGVLCQDREHVPLAIVRAALTLLEEHVGSPHPLCAPAMLSGGKEFFAARFGALTGMSRHGQAAISAMLGAYLERIEWSERGDPARLLIFTRGHPEGPRYVMLDPEVRSGEPCITETTVTTAEVSERFGEGESVMALARSYGRSPDEIEEAVRYGSHVRWP